MSRRKRPTATTPQAAAPVQAGGPPPEARPLRRLALELAALGALVAATVGIAELAGAANLGVALGIGQAVFAVALVVLLIRD